MSDYQQFLPQGGVIRHDLHNMCLEGRGAEIEVRTCDDNNENQKWQFNSYPFEEKERNEKL